MSRNIFLPSIDIYYVYPMLITKLYRKGIFWKVSPYAQSDPNYTSLKTLLSIPIRISNEPDINWYIENRRIDYYCINSIDSAAMINWLKAFGNNKAELIITSGKGYRVKNNMRHPHSWTIAEGDELVNWMSKKLN